MNKKIVMIAGDWYYPKMVYQNLSTEFEIDKIIIDNGEKSTKLIKRRIKRLGIIHVIGQILFKLIAMSYMNFRSKNRIKEILKSNHIYQKEFENNKRIKVDSINSKHGHKVLKEINPDIVILSTTRIISKKTLQNIDAVFINIHAGITPYYRGLHGAYWALINNDKEHCGVTVHLVDEDIDTGAIIGQSTIINQITSKDNFMSYTYLQLAAALPILKKAILNIQENKLKTTQNKKEDIKNQLFYHPTLWFYLYNRWFRGIK